MDKGPFRTEFIKSSIERYRQELYYIFPIPDLDCLIDFHTDGINDTRVLQLPFIIALGIMIPMDKPLKVLSSQSHAGDQIWRLDRWMSDARIAIDLGTPSLPLVRALLLAVLCYQYDGSITVASDCFEKAKVMFDDILFVLGGLDGLEKRLPADDFCDLALTSWGFSNFAFLDLTDSSPVLIPLVKLNLGLVQEKYGRQAGEILLKKQSWIDFKTQASDLQPSSVASKPLLTILRTFKALQIPTNPTSGGIIYPIAYFEGVHCYAYTYYQAVSMYRSLPHEAQQVLGPELSQCAQSYRDLVEKAQEQLEALQNLERSRLEFL